MSQIKVALKFSWFDMKNAQKNLDDAIRDQDKACLAFDTLQANFEIAQIQIKELEDKLSS